MKYYINIIFIISSMSFGSCEFGRYARSEPMTPQYSPRETITESLFEAKDRTISEENIKKLLDGKLYIPDSLRVAVYKYKSITYGSYSKVYNASDDENLLKNQQRFMDTLVFSMDKAKRVRRVNVIPSMMLSLRPNITELRESAVRLQSDMLLVFNTTSDIYYRFKLLKSDEAKAHATTEAILMDTRTGLIAFTTVITKECLLKAIPNELIEETRKRAEREAVLQTLGVVGEKLKHYFDNVEKY